MLENSIGIKLVRIPAGEFDMGSEDGGEDDKPVHRVRITKPFFLGHTPVTIAQWKHVMGTMPSSKRKADNRPVTQVSWDDAVAFCQQLSKHPDELRAGHAYWLPTEAEWEYACRASSNTRYSFGDDESQCADYAWYNANSGDREHPVGQKKPNKWGLFDMHGNVWEWCSDLYGPYASDATTDPQGSSEGSDRVFRGGSWGNAAEHCRSAFRNGSPPWIGGFNLGFRLAMRSSGGEPREAAAAKLAK